MAKIRAYKLAEELGIDRAEFVERAAAAGIPLKSAMASLDDAEVEKLRKKLGGSRAPSSAVTEQRVEGDTGSAVIRRRKKAVAPEPAPEPVAPPPPPAVVAPPPPASVAVESPAPPVAATPIPEPEPVPESIAAAAAAPEPLLPQDLDTAEKRGRGAGAGRTAAAAAETADRAAKERKRVREVVNLREQENLARQATSRTLVRRPISMEPRATASPRRRRRDAPAPEKSAAPRAAREEKRVLRIDGSVSVGELARMLGVKAAAVQRELMKLGTMVAIHQTVDLETARTVGAEFGFEVQDVAFREQDYLADERVAEEAARVPRPPIITVMGHVDHGKTSLLDAIRKTDVVAGEAGGITQHIGAYQVSIGEKKLTFIDTPGHAAFTAMRARGAQLTDVVVLVVAATEGVMPQTVEAIDHARSAGVPIVVAINKCDLPGANPQQTRQRLMEHGLVPEDFGGETICVNVSATKGTGLEQLLEMLSLQADVLELRADPSRRAVGVVVESQLDKGRGPVATVLVRDGTLRRGDMLVVGTVFGRVRAMEDEKARRLDEALPSTPVQVIGLSGVPEAGAPVHAVESERVAKEIIDHRISSARRAPTEEARTALSLEEFFGQAESGGVKELPILVKADVHGSVEALREALLKLSTDAVKVNVVHSGVGAVTETDVMLAKATGAIVVAFHVRPEPAARRAAEAQGVDIRAYQIIYEVSDEIRKAMTGLLPPTVTENFLGRAEVRATFNVPRVGTIAGCYVTEGSIRRGGMARLLRDGVQIYEGRISSLKRFKDDAREVAQGFECGIGIEGFNDVKIGDVIESYVREERAATLE
jgi:translation initiation factor IF-2